MKTLTFIAITLFSGAIACTLLGLINQVVVEPFIDKAIEIQTQRAVNAGENIDPVPWVAKGWRSSCEYYIRYIAVSIIWYSLCI